VKTASAQAITWQIHDAGGNRLTVPHCMSALA
jgi:hypothetical protein